MRMHKIILACVLMVSCLGCSGGANVHTEDQSTINPTWEEEDHSFMAPRFFDLIPTKDGNQCMFVNDVVYLGDPSKSAKMIPYCSKSGCKHDSMECPAYVGPNVLAFSPYHDKWYYIQSNEDQSHIFFVEHDHTTNGRKKLWECSTYEEDRAVHTFNVVPQTIRHERLYFLVQEMIFHPEKNSNSKEYFHMLDLHTGKDTVLKEFDITQYGHSPVAVSDDALYMESVTDIVDLGGGYETYAALEKMDLKTGEVQVVVPAETRMHAHFHPYGRTFNDELVYITDKELHLYNTKTGEDRVVESIDEGRMLYMNLCGNVIYWSMVKEDRNDIHMFKTDCKRGETKEIVSPHTDGAFECSLYSAAGNGIFGKMEDNNGDLKSVWMTCEDYENGRYEKAVFPEGIKQDK